VALDGCYIEKSRGDDLTFWAAPPPTRVDLAQVAWGSRERVTRLREKRGKYFDVDPSENPLATDQPLLAACYAASLQGVVTLGERAGRPLARVGQTAGARDPSQADAASLTPGHGYNLHAGVRVGAQDRRGLTRLCKYVARGPLANDRLSLMPDGRVAYRLRRTWRDSTTRLVFTPHDFISKLVPLISRPLRRQISCVQISYPPQNPLPRPLRAERSPALTGGAGPARDQPATEATPPTCAQERQGGERSR